MEKEEQELTPEENPEFKPKSMWQITKESWYDKLPVTLKQMDTIVLVCWIAIAVLVIVIVLDALDIFNPFGH